MNTKRKASLLIKLAQKESSWWDDATSMVNRGAGATSEWWKNVNPWGERQQKASRSPYVRKQLSDAESREGLGGLRVAPRPTDGPLAWNKPAAKTAPKKGAPARKAPPKLAPSVPGMEGHPADAASRALGLPAPSKVLKKKTFMDAAPVAAKPASAFTHGKGQGYWHLAKQVNKRYGFGGKGSTRKKVTSRELRGLMGGQMLGTRDYSFDKDQFLGKSTKGSLSGAGGLKGKKLQRAISSGASFRKNRALAKAKKPVVMEKAKVSPGGVRVSWPKDGPSAGANRLLHNLRATDRAARIAKAKAAPSTAPTAASRAAGRFLRSRGKTVSPTMKAIAEGQIAKGRTLTSRERARTATAVRKASSPKPAQVASRK